jgi:hypothetical protein
MLMLQAFRERPAMGIDQLTYGIWLQALWAIPTVLDEIDLEDMRAEALRRGSTADLRLVASLMQVKKERHRP